ncbi:MAG: N-6 DNA methylase [Cyanobacteria bacterium]|nr:N-6 DNA methylase [Cyanobacteriota bacterium]
MAGAPPVIAGFGGGLISHMYLEERVLPSIERADLGSFERRMARWWHRVTRSLGPASSVRAVADIAALPLLELLEHERPPVAAFGAGLIARLPRAALLIEPWAEPSSAMWRDAIRAGLADRDRWAIVCNGRSLRVIDCTRSWSRASIEFDFEQLMTGPKGVATLWALTRAPVVTGTIAASLDSRIAESDAHASRVCRSLGDGVLSSLPALTTALAIGTHRASAFDQSLTLVYRILFLLFAEARALVPIWNDVYRDGYTIDALIARSLPRRGRGEGGKGLWKTFQAISRLAHAGCKAGDLDVTAFNGRLFSPRHTLLIEQRQVPDAVMREVLQALASEATPQGRRRISYHDLGVEQLGSVYERVLEHEPTASGSAIALTRTSRRRKITGSFYTPQALTEFLVRRTLAPLVEGRSAGEILQLRVVDPAMGSGAFLVAACVYLAECCEQALVRDGALSAADVATADRASLRRQVAERCLYGVDLNPTAVQLSRLSLWLTTLAASKPLTFLDHHLAAGNSLIGAWLRDLSRPPVSRSGRPPAALPLFDDQLTDDVSARVMPMRLRLAEPSDSLAIVKHKERVMAALSAPGGPLAKWSAAADAWCAAAHWPGAPPSAGVVSEWIAAATGSPTSLPPAQLRASLQRARDVAASHSAFHWELAFPEVFFDANGQLGEGGFDAVIGNPPWSVLQASRGYRAHSTGHPNSYQLFLERALLLTKRGGRVGLILPSGIATDHGSAALRRQLLDQTTIDTWIGFDNRGRIFPIHRSVRFVVLATTRGGATETLRFRCGLTSVRELDRVDQKMPLTLSRARIESLSPDHLTIPEVTTPAALGIITAIADRVPSLADPRGWGVRFGRELNATEDRHRFVPIGSRRGLLPIVEGKQLSPFQVDVSRSTHAIAGKPTTDRIAYRDVASATNKLTLIAAMLPANTASTHTVFCLKTPLDAESQWALLGLMNSLVANYLVRLNVTTHVTAAVMSRLRVPRPESGSRGFIRLASLARTLASTGIDANATAYAELNALAARLYGVTHEQYAFILDSFPLISISQRRLCLDTLVAKNIHRSTEAQKHRL